jgi:hypothetical protein
VHHATQVPALKEQLNKSRTSGFGWPINIFVVGLHKTFGTIGSPSDMYVCWRAKPRICVAINGVGNVQGSLKPMNKHI